MRRLSAEDLQTFVVAALTALHLPSDDANVVARRMIEADVIGADAHGIFRLPRYAERLRAGGYNAKPRLTVQQSGPGTAVIDGDNGMGHLVMTRAAETAVKLARESGVAWIGARASNHAGAASVYIDIVLSAGMIGIYSAVASANHMPPWGGKDLLLGTNPLAIGIPLAGSPPVVLDIATTVVSYGTVKARALRGEPMPEGWMVEKSTAQPLTDSQRSEEGFLLPIGGYKGAGLSLVLGRLAGALNSAAFGRDVIDFNADDHTAANTGQFIVALDVGRFMDPVLFAKAARRHLSDLRASDRLPGFENIRLPGDERAKRRSERRLHGVPIPDELLSKLNDLAADLSISPLGEA